MIHTSESVTAGHPDKMADQISDAVLDEILAGDPASRVAVETLVTTGIVVIAGEVTTRSYVDIGAVARKTIKDIGYDRTDLGYDGDTVGVLVALDSQSADIALGTDGGGAGDQGMMFGYACNDTPEYLPVPIALAHRLTAALTEARISGRIPYLRPDGKAQVSLSQHRHSLTSEWVLTDLVLSAQHANHVDTDSVRHDLWDEVITPTLDRFSEVVPTFASELESCDDARVHINPTGRFVIGGPVGDAGLTGRKIIVDTYGSAAPHGGGAFSGKDPSKVDRSAAYAARWAAKNVVAAGLAETCLVKLAYAIGLPDPVAVDVVTVGSIYTDAAIVDAVRSCFEFSVGNITHDLWLRKPSDYGWSYRETASGGHFGRDQFPWETLNRVDALRDAVRRTNA